MPIRSSSGTIALTGACIIAVAGCASAAGSRSDGERPGAAVGDAEQLARRPLEAQMVFPAADRVQVALSRPAYVAVVAVVPKAGVRLLYPSARADTAAKPGGVSEIVLPGPTSVWEEEFRRRSSIAWGSWPKQGAVVAIASDAPLVLAPLLADPQAVHRQLGDKPLSARGYRKTVEAVALAIVAPRPETSWAVIGQEPQGQRSGGSAAGAVTTPAGTWDPNDLVGTGRRSRTGAGADVYTQPRPSAAPTPPAPPPKTPE